MPWQVDPSHSSIEFSAKHMLVASVKGRFDEFAVEADIDPENITASKAVIHIQAASLDTRDGQRDGHLRSPDFLDVESHPEITFETKRIEPKGKGEFAIVGDLTIRGKSKEVAFEGEINGPATNPWGQRVVSVSAEAKVNRKEWGLNWNAALEAGGFLVGDTVKLSIDAELVEAA